MVIIETYHYKERLADRSWKPSETVKKQFIECVKLMKKKKIHPRKGATKNTHSIQYAGNRFVFEKREGKYILVTYVKSNLPY